MRRLLAHCVGLAVAFALGCQNQRDDEPISFTSILYESYRPDSGSGEAEPEDDGASSAYDGGVCADASVVECSEVDGGQEWIEAGVLPPEETW